jgi:nucleoside-diphosphate-sugar epimerase
MAEAPILVTGSNGLIGHALVRRLLADGRPVVATDQRPADGLDIPTIVLDLRDRLAIDVLVARHRPRAIVHTGGLSGPMVAPNDPALVFDVNVGGTVNVCEAARRHGVGRLIFLSSITAYGDQPDDREVTEATPLLATEPYGASKVAGEAVLRAFSRYGVEGTSLRLGGVYGPRRTTDCLIRLMLENALAGVPTRIGYGAGWQRQYVFVDDAVDAILLAVETRGLPLPAYNVTAGTSIPLEDVAAAARQAVPTVDATFAPGTHPFDNRVGRLDIAAAGRDLGYRPKTSLVEGIRAYAAWLKSSSPLAGEEGAHGAAMGR